MNVAMEEFVFQTYVANFGTGGTSTNGVLMLPTETKVIQKGVGHIIIDMRKHDPSRVCAKFKDVRYNNVPYILK